MKRRTTSPVIQLVQGLALIMALGLVGAFLMGTLWEIICWLRTFGVEGAFVDKAEAVRKAIALETHSAESFFLQLVEETINWYSRTFAGNARFGSGLGLIAGVITALAILRKRIDNRIVLSASGIVAGAVIGARFCLFLSSKLIPFVFCITAGALLVAAFMSIRDEPIPRLLIARTNSSPSAN